MRSHPVDYDWQQVHGDDILSGKAKKFRLGCDSVEEIETLFDLSYATGDCTLLIEESGLVFSKRESLSDSILRVIFTGRHRRVNLLLLAQRAVSIPVDLRSQANRVVCFRQIEARDIDAVCGLIGRQYKDAVPALPELKCLDWQNGRVSAYDLHFDKKRANFGASDTEIDEEITESPSTNEENESA